MKTYFYLLLLVAICIFPFEANAQRYQDILFGQVDSTTVVYGQNVDYTGALQQLQMDIFQPHGDTAQNRPAIVLVHGGNFTAGDRKNADVNLLCKAFARRGYVAASIDYRLGFGLDFFPKDSIKRRDSIIWATLRAMQDTKAAIRYMRGNAAAYKVDSNKIYVGGSSAGAIAALISVYLKDSSQLAEVVPEGPVLLRQIGGLEGSTGNGSHSSAVAGVVNLCGAVGRANWIKPGEPPVISMHGDKDRTVPYKHAEIVINIDFNFALEGSYLIDSAARANGIKSALYTWVNKGHVPYADSRQDMAKVISFVTCNMYKLLQPNGDTSGCYARQYDTIFTSIAPYAITETESLGIFPNPAHDYVNISANGPISQLHIYDVTGSEVYNYYQAGPQGMYYTGNLPAGIYLIRCLQGNRQLTKRLVIQ